MVWANRKEFMAKALLGHVGGPDPRLVDEVRRLRRRVTDLETEIGRLLAERELLTEAALERALAPTGSTRDARLDGLDDLHSRTAVLT